MNLKFWDSRARLIAAIARLTDDEAREVVKKARPGWTLSAIGKRAKTVNANRDKEAEQGFEDYDRRREDEATSKSQ